MALSDPQFWIALLQIIGVNIVLSGDNAVVIALAALSGLQSALHERRASWVASRRVRGPSSRTRPTAAAAGSRPRAAGRRLRPGARKVVGRFRK